MTSGGMPVGAWTDDTSMTLCLAESLVETNDFHPLDQLERYSRWYKEGYLSSIPGDCFDIGNSTRQSIEKYLSSKVSGDPIPFPGDMFPDAAGNGSLMRLAPVSLAYHNI